jgi:hypothetical protein
VIKLDPDLSKDYLEPIQNWMKEKKRYTFDHVYAPGAPIQYVRVYYVLLLVVIAWPYSDTGLGR